VRQNGRERFINVGSPGSEQLRTMGDLGSLFPGRGRSGSTGAWLRSQSIAFR
jgi:hypothetical protein